MTPQARSSPCSLLTSVWNAEEEPHSPEMWGARAWSPTTVARHSYDTHGQPSPRRKDGACVRHLEV